mgnify:CR=1 FL=1
MWNAELGFMATRPATSNDDRIGWRRGSLRPRSRASLGVALAFVAALAMGAGSVPQAAAQDPSFETGSGRASARYLKVGPSRGSLALAPTVGLALSDFLNTRGRGDVRTVDFAALEDSLPPELVEALPTVKVESTDEGSEDGQTVALGTPPEVPVGLSAATLRASAGAGPSGRSSFETAPVDLGLLAVSGGTAEAFSGVVDGNVREAVGIVEIGRVDIGGGAFVLEGLRWHAMHRTGADSVEQGSFTVGAVSVAGQRFAAPDGVEQPLAEALAAAEPLLGPLGLKITLPQPRIEGGIVEMTPLRIRVADSEVGAVIGPVLEAAQPARDALVDAIRTGSEDVDVALLLTDVALGVLAGGSTLDIELGGVTAQTAEAAEAFSFGNSGGGFDLSPPAPEASVAPVTASVPYDASSSLGSASTSSVEPPAPLAGAGAGVAADDSATSDIAANTVPVSSSATGGGAGPLLLIGLAAAAAAVGAGAVDYRRLLRRPALAA